MNHLGSTTACSSSVFINVTLANLSATCHLRRSPHIVTRFLWALGLRNWAAALISGDV